MERYNNLGYFIAKVADYLSRNQITPKTGEWLFSSTLTPLKKKLNGLRPIAMSETLVRITGKMLIERQDELATDFLSPQQLGVNTSNGTTAVAAMVRYLQTAYGDQDNVAVLQVDFDNAFNLVNRNAVLRTVRANFPGLFSYFNASCGENKPSIHAPIDGDDLNAFVFPNCWLSTETIETPRCARWSWQCKVCDRACRSRPCCLRVC